jgi:glyoxylase-like metal-dependent hydrolase (beta-lactamase superfamily II)
MHAALWLTMTIAQSAATPAVAVPPPQEIAPGIALLRGAILPERGPDGNTVVFDAPDGLVVLDTGRHAWHSDAILAYAKARGRPVAAIVNTHWHLDHTSGNGRIKAAFPKAQVYATNAVDRALAPGGFLARSLESSRPMLDDAKVPETEKEEVKVFLDTMAASDALRPDVVVAAGGVKTIAGRALDLRITDGAVTDADLWIYDAGSRVAAIGDLVTFPSPFFETACPAAWRRALDDVWATPFTTAIPGHGEPMSRAQFDAWRGAFNRFVDCAEGTAEPGQCAAAWADGIASFNGGDERARKMSLGYAEYYVGFLRENGGKSRDCLAR